MSDQPYIRSASEYLQALRRQKFWILVPILIITPLVVLLAYTLPVTYRSEATILIEGENLPQGFVPSAMNSYADRRVQVISQRVLSTNTIGTIIDKFNLYPDVDRDMPNINSKLAGEFRGSVDLDLVSVEVIDPRSGRPTEATIAFTLAFESDDPATAQQITSELVTLFLSENARERTEQAVSTAEFLATESGQLNNELLAIEQKLADFKSANEGSLPEQYSFNLSTLDRTQRELVDVSNRVKELVKRRIELSGKMAQISPSAPSVLPTGEIVMSNVDRLRSLEAEYRRKAALYNANHPDVIRLEREISTLRTELGVGDDVNDLQRQLREQREKLAQLQTKYSDQHYEVQSTRSVIAQLESSIATSGQPVGTAGRGVADNPAYVLLQTELESVESDISVLKSKELELRSKTADFELRLKNTPEVEKTYNALLRDYNNATTEYRDIKAKQRGAMVAMNLEQEQKGEQFVLLEPPVAPLNPVSPNRPAIIFIGAMLAAGFGFALGLFRELMDGSVHSVRELADAMGEAPLVAVPYIDNDVELNQLQTMRRSGAIALSFALLAAVLFYVFRMVMA